MAFGSSSAVFVAHVVSTFGTRGTGDTGFVGANTIKAALFNDSVTPDKNAAVGNTGYNTGTWLTANEVTDVTNWAAGGRTLASKTGAQVGSTSVARFDAADTSGGGSLTISNARGCLVYNDSVTAGTVAKQGICFNSFGGAQSVTGGTFTIVWSANGIFEVTV